MVVNYSKIFTVTNVISGGPVTVLVETSRSGNEVVIATLEGEYSSTDEFEREYKSPRNRDKIRIILPVALIDARMILDSLNEALQVSD